MLLQQLLEFQALDHGLVVEHERQLVLPGQGQLGDYLAGAQMELDLFAGQILTLATNDAAVLVGIAQLALVGTKKSGAGA